MCACICVYACVSMCVRICVYVFHDSSSYLSALLACEVLGFIPRAAQNGSRVERNEGRIVKDL